MCSKNKRFKEFRIVSRIREGINSPQYVTVAHVKAESNGSGRINFHKVLPIWFLVGIWLCCQGAIIYSSRSRDIQIATRKPQMFQFILNLNIIANYIS